MEKEFDKKYTWVIENLSSLESEMIYSSHFITGGCKWRFSVYPKGHSDSNCLSVFLGVADFQSLPSGWRRHAKFRLTVVNQLHRKLSRQEEALRWFEDGNAAWGFPSLLPLTELHAKNGGFMVNGEVMVIAEINVVEIIGTLDVTEETSSPVIESVDVNGFQVPSSQVAFVKRLFDRHPNIASDFYLQNPFLKTAYMNVLFGVTSTLSQAPQEISTDDLVHASSAMLFLKLAGFNMGWLKEKLDEVKENKVRAVVDEIWIEEIDEKLKDLKELEALLEKEKTDILANSDSLLLKDVF